MFDIDPPEGPLKGGTLVTLLGSNYEDTGTIKCQFSRIGEKSIVVPGSYKSPSQIQCITPKFYSSGYVDLQIELRANHYSHPI